MLYRLLYLSILVCISGFSIGQTVQNDSTKAGQYKQFSGQQLQIKGYFKEGKRHKIWVWYSQEGFITKQVKYRHGRPLWAIYYEQNKPWLKVNRVGRKRVIRACDCRVPDY